MEEEDGEPTATIMTRRSTSISMRDFVMCVSSADITDGDEGTVISGGSWRGECERWRESACAWEERYVAQTAIIVSLEARLTRNEGEDHSHAALKNAVGRRQIILRVDELEKQVRDRDRDVLEREQRKCELEIRLGRFVADAAEREERLDVKRKEAVEKAEVSKAERKKEKAAHASRVTLLHAAVKEQERRVTEAVAATAAEAQLHAATKRTLLNARAQIERHALRFEAVQARGREDREQLRQALKEATQLHEDSLVREQGIHRDHSGLADLFRRLCGVETRINATLKQVSCWATRLTDGPLPTRPLIAEARRDLPNLRKAALALAHERAQIDDLYDRNFVNKKKQPGAVNHHRRPGSPPARSRSAMAASRRPYQRQTRSFEDQDKQLYDDANVLSDWRAGSWDVHAAQPASVPTRPDSARPQRGTYETTRTASPEQQQAAKRPQRPKSAQARSPSQQRSQQRSLLLGVTGSRETEAPSKDPATPVESAAPPAEAQQRTLLGKTRSDEREAPFKAPATPRVEKNAAPLAEAPAPPQPKPPSPVCVAALSDDRQNMKKNTKPTTTDESDDRRFLPIEADAGA